MCTTTKMASMQKLNITTDTLISVYDVTHLKIKESSSGLSKKFSPPSRGPCRRAAALAAAQAASFAFRSHRMRGSAP